MNTARYMTLVAVAAVLLSVASCRDASDSTAAIERHKRLAGELRDNRLYRAAIEEYEKLLAISDVDDKTRANVNYLVGRIYYENLAEYEQAAAYYLRARALDPEGSFVAEASKNLVASLEKMGHILDARRQLTAATDIDAAPAREGDVAVARVGGTPVWLSEIEEHIQSLPPEMQSQFTTREAKLEYVRQYVAVELLYRAAVREDYGSDPEIQKQERLLHKKLMVDKYVLDKVMPQIRIDTADVRNFYAAHREDRYKDAPYDSVRAQVFLDYQGEKAEAAFSEYIDILSKTEKVEFLDGNVK